MTLLEKLLTIREAYETLIPCIKNNAVQDLNLVLCKAPNILAELIRVEEAKATDGLHRAAINITVNPTAEKFGVDITSALTPEPPENHEFNGIDYPAAYIAYRMLQHIHDELDDLKASITEEEN